MRHGRASKKWYSWRQKTYLHNGTRSLEYGSLTEAQHPRYLYHPLKNHASCASWTCLRQLGHAGWSAWLKADDCTEGAGEGGRGSCLTKTGLFDVKLLTALLYRSLASITSTILFHRNGSNQTIQGSNQHLMSELFALHIRGRSQHIKKLLPCGFHVAHLPVWMEIVPGHVPWQILFLHDVHIGIIAERTKPCPQWHRPKTWIGTSSRHRSCRRALVVYYFWF